MDETEVILKRSTTPASSPGEKLRYARENKRLSQHEAAKALCLPVAVIDALEKDAYEKLHAPVFARGYFKNYAGFLGLAVNQKDDNIPAAAVYSSSLSERFSSKKSTLNLLGYLLLKLLNYAVFIGILSVVFLWWHEKHHAAEKTISLNNLSIQQVPFPRPHLEPVPPDLTPWREDIPVRVSTKGDNS
jgi:cytoskeleton protein RodZ